jgi:hypothetical protein
MVGLERMSDYTGLVLDYRGFTVFSKNQMYFLEKDSVTRGMCYLNLINMDAG